MIKDWIGLDWGGEQTPQLLSQKFLRPETFEKKICESLRPRTLCVRDAFCAPAAAAAANTHDVLRCELHLSFDLRPLQNIRNRYPCASRTVL